MAPETCALRQSLGHSTIWLGLSLSSSGFAAGLLLLLTLSHCVETITVCQNVRRYEKEQIRLLYAVLIGSEEDTDERQVAQERDFLLNGLLIVSH